MAETLPMPDAGSAPLDVGALISDTYEVVRLIGKGGMGEVWAARHRRLPGKLVAVKVLHTGGKALTTEALARFRREAEIASRIGHPNIVQVLDFNTLPSGAPYLVLELLQGESLANKLRFGPLGVDEAISIARQTGSALHAAHALGIVHRDLKPDNVFLVSTPMGTMVKVLDFGISKVKDSTTVQTQEAVLLGTPQYMSPEQAIGNNKEVGPASDIFALGAITYEMLCGQPPFQSESVAQVVFQIAYQPHPPLAQRKADLPPRVVQAVEKALLKDRAHRYSDIAEFATDLSGRPLHDTSTPALPQSVTGPSGVATPSMASPSEAGPQAFAPTAMSTPAPKPQAPQAVADDHTNVSSSGKQKVSYTSSSSKKWVAYVVAAGVMAGVAGTSFLAGRPSRSAEAPPSLSLAERAQTVPSQKAAKVVARNDSAGAPAAQPPVAPTAPSVEQVKAKAGPQVAGVVSGVQTTPAPSPKLPEEPKKVEAVVAAAAPPPISEFAKGQDVGRLEALAALVAQNSSELNTDRPRLVDPLEGLRAKQYGYALYVEHACDRQEQLKAQGWFHKVKAHKLQRMVRDYCRGKIDEGFLEK